MKQIQFIKGQRNTTILIADNYIYNFERKRDCKCIYRCRIRVCPGRICLDQQSKMVISYTQHTHETCESTIKKLLFQNKIYEKSKLENEDFDDIFSNAVHETKTNLNETIVNLKNMRDYVNKIKRKK